MFPRSRAAATAQITPSPCPRVCPGERSAVKDGGQAAQMPRARQTPTGSGTPEARRVTVGCFLLELAVNAGNENDHRPHASLTPNQEKDVQIPNYLLN